MQLVGSKLEFEHGSFGNPFKMLLTMTSPQFPRSWPRKPEKLPADGSRSPTAAAGTAFAPASLAEGLPRENPAWPAGRTATVCTSPRSPCDLHGPVSIPRESAVLCRVTHLKTESGLELKTHDSQPRVFLLFSPICCCCCCDKIHVT